jgi:hypothetical protein
MMSKTDRIKIFLKTQLADKTCSTIKVKKNDNKRIESIIQNKQQNPAFIENASLLVI